MTTPDRADIAGRARSLLEDARAVEACVDSAASELLRLGGAVARAGTRSEAARLGSKVAAERELLSGLLDELTAAAGAADKLDVELARSSDDNHCGEARRDDVRLGDARRGQARRDSARRGEARRDSARRGQARRDDALPGETRDRHDAEARATLGAVRHIVDTAGGRGRESVWIGELATDRVRDLAEFDLLLARAHQHLALADFQAAEAVLPQLVGLDRSLLAPEVSVLLDELKFRLQTDRD